MPATPSAHAVLVRVPSGVLSHEEAARHLGIPLVEDLGRQRLTVPRNWGRVRVPGWDVVRRPVGEQEQLVLPTGLRVTAGGRTVGDLARVLPLAHAVAAADGALRLRLVSAALLADVLGSARGPGAPALRAVHGLVDPSAGSVLESLLRVLLLTSGLPAPRTQFQVVERGELVARVDFAWPEQRLIVEADGFAFHSDREAYRRDRERMNTLERLGWRVLRFTWEDVVNRPGYVVGLVRSCLALAA